ncbi:secreted protein [gut metagenome]|uniref:Secreted protein n=1 Tax=gut metagenome TaxID=749906 RepID=J9CID7_9ZZZZ
MKKTLLTLACTALMCGTAHAQVYERHLGNHFHKLSENGLWLVEDEGAIVTYNRETKEKIMVEDPVTDLTVGMGNSMLNDGTVCIANGNKGPALLKDSVITQLEAGRELAPGETLSLSIAHGATNDGKRIVGLLNAPKDRDKERDIMAIPVMWEKNAKGEYKIQTLPYPKKDFTGRPPQFVSAIDIADDGKTIVGQVQSYSGFHPTPIVWKEDAQGKWNYSLPGGSLVYNADALAKLPEAPVEPKQPKAEDYMNKEDSVNYEKALAEYKELYALAQLGEIPWSDVPKYPQKSDYISDKAKADAYADALMDYNKKDEQYWKDFAAYNEVLDGALTGNSFILNNVTLSRNGKYMVASLEKSESDPEDFWNQSVTVSPCRFYLDEKNDSVEILANLHDHLGSCIANNGLLVAVTPAIEYTRNTYVSLPGQPAQTLVDYLKAEKQDSVVKFLKDNFTYTFNVEVGVDSMGAPIYQEVQDSTITGSVTINGEGNRMVSFIYDAMSNPEDPKWVSFYIDLTKNADPSAIENVVNKENAGEVLRREYYNLQGQRIAQPTKGIYLEKVITTNGVYTKKVLK